jgi:hypothetical protein
MKASISLVGGEDFFDPRRVDARRRQLVQGLASDFRRTIEPLTMTTPGVSSMMTSTPVTFSKPDVPPFAADDPRFFVAGNIDGAGRALRGVAAAYR